MNKKYTIPLIMGVIIFTIFLIIFNYKDISQDKPIISSDGTVSGLDLSQATNSQLAFGGEAVDFRFPYKSDLSEYQAILGVSDTSGLFGLGLDPYPNDLPPSYAAVSGATDAFGYPMRKTFLHTQIENKNKTLTGSQNIAKLLSPQSVRASVGTVIPGTAYLHDADFPGLYHCKESDEDQSYFIVYFEDIALYEAGEAGPVGFAQLSDGIQRVQATCDVFVEYDQMLKMNEMQIPVNPSIVFYRFENHLPPQALGNASSFYLDFEDNFSHTFLQQHITKGIPNIPGIWNFDGYIDINHAIPWSF